jgi:hypothetical protein
MLENACSKPWDVEFQEDRARKSPQSVAENVDLLFPCLTLVDLEVMGVRRSQGTEDMVWIRSQETVDWS